MTIDFEVYLNKKPEFDGPLLNELSLIPFPDYLGFGFNQYLWQSVYEDESSVRVTFHPDPFRGNNDFYCIEDCFDEEKFKQKVTKLKEKSIGVLRVLDKIRKCNGDVEADEEMYRLLQHYPGLAEIFPELEPVWGIANHSKGAPTYQVYLEAKAYASKQVLDGMVHLGMSLASNYDGIMWSYYKFGFPDIARIHEIYSEVLRDLEMKLSEEELEELYGPMQDGPLSESCQIIQFPQRK